MEFAGPADGGCSQHQCIQLYIVYIRDNQMGFCMEWSAEPQALLVG